MPSGNVSTALDGEVYDHVSSTSRTDATTESDGGIQGACAGGAQSGNQATFIGAFPNFYYATYGLKEVGGTIFVKDSAAEWRDVPLADLDNPALEDFAQRMRATAVYATSQGFIGGFPNFFHADYGQGVVCGTILIKDDAAEWRDVPLADLGDPPLDDIGQRFRATQTYATSQGFIGGFPNFLHADYGQGIVCGTVLLPATSSEWRDVVLFEGPR